MKRTMAVAVVGLPLAGSGTVHAAGQPQCDSGQTAGAVPGQQYGTEANRQAKKQADAQKYQEAGADSATAACPERPAAPDMGAASDRKL